MYQGGQDNPDFNETALSSVYIPLPTGQDYCSLLLSLQLLSLGDESARNEYETDV